ncbi:MAG: hypothetical protein J5640_05705 [Bacteroidales bacterium]|nr:hypothetical protein [Bacteroidales bacterium]
MDKMIAILYLYFFFKINVRGPFSGGQRHILIMRNIVLACVLLCMLIGCGTGEVMKSLKEIDSSIQEKPKEALAILAEMDSASICSPKEKALYSLLYSMALDKNYIDLQSDSIIKPAARYYSHHGDRYHRFLAFYYQGRVYENAADYNEALSAYLRAEQLSKRALPDDYVSRLHSAKARLYFKQLALDRALEETIKSKTVAANLENPLFYIRNSLDVAALHTNTGDVEEAAEELDSLKSWMAVRNIQAPATYYESLLRIALADLNAAADVLTPKYEDYISSCVASGTTPDNLLTCRALMRTGRLKDAEEAISQYQLLPNTPEFTQLNYYGTLEELYKATGNYRLAFETLLEYQIIQENVQLRIFNNDLRFQEERYNNLIQRSRDMRLKVLLSLLAALLLSALIYFGTVWKKRDKANKEALVSVRSEYKYISGLLDSTNENPENFRNTLTSRLQALRPYIYSDKLSPSMFSARKDIEHIDEGRKEMLKNIGMVYALSYPHFVSKLLEYGLSAEEVGLCSLYIAGYSSKEMNTYLHTGSILHINGNIRKKIGSTVEGVKLQTWLKQVFSDAEGPNPSTRGNY